MLWYDGLHDYEHVKEALEFWGEKVDDMIIDCYDEIHPGTVKAVDEYKYRPEVSFYWVDSNSLSALKPGIHLKYISPILRIFFFCYFSFLYFEFIYNFAPTFGSISRALSQRTFLRGH